MKCKFKILIMTALVIFSSNLFSQNRLRTVFETTLTTSVFAVPKDTKVEELSDMDLNKMIAEDKIVEKETFIDDNYQMNIISIFPQMPRWEYDYEFEIGKTIINKEGLFFYNHQDSLIYSNKDTVEINMNEDSLNKYDFLNIDSILVDYYGLNKMFSIDLQYYIDLYDEIGFTTLINSEGAFSAINDSIEIYINPKKLITETRYFDYNGNITFSDWRRFQKIDTYVIPLVNVLTTYENLFSGIRLQRSDITEYTKYKILDKDGTEIVFYEKEEQIVKKKNGSLEFSEYTPVEKKNGELIVYPNPANSLINIELPYYASEKNDIEILNSMGLIVKRENNVLSGSRITINISDLKPGIYLIRNGSEGKWKTTKFVKN